MPESVEAAAVVGAFSGHTNPVARGFFFENPHQKQCLACQY